MWGTAGRLVLGVRSMRGAVWGELPQRLGTSPGKFLGGVEVELPQGSCNFWGELVISTGGTNFPGEVS